MEMEFLWFWINFKEFSYFFGIMVCLRVGSLGICFEVGNWISIVFDILIIIF